MLDKKFPGPTWTSDHIYGQGLMNHSRKLTYYNTPKCASMWMRAYLAQLGTTVDDIWEEHYFTQEDTTNCRPLVIVRDPIKRWLSICPAVDALPRFVANDAVDGMFQNFSAFLMDEHCAPQYDFIDGLDLSNAVYFWCDQDLSKKINHFLVSEGFIDINPPEPINEQPDTENFKISVNIWKNLLEIPQYLNIFKQAYARDYDLISRIKFYEYK
jgi:hypothetical protein